MKRMTGPCIASATMWCGWSQGGGDSIRNVKSNPALWQKGFDSHKLACEMQSYSAKHNIHPYAGANHDFAGDALPREVRAMWHKMVKRQRKQTQSSNDRQKVHKEEADL